MDIQKAINYLYTYGRPLDQRVYELRFGDGTETAVLDTLAVYQNRDGGFGHAIEPDLRTPVSSAIATSTAFGFLRGLSAPSHHPVVQNAVRYFLDSFDHQKQVWPIIPPQADNAPRAFWWAYADSEKNFGHFLHNPRAAILGHLYAYVDLVPADFLSELTEIQLAYLEKSADDLDMFSLDCYVGLAAAPLPDAVHTRLNATIEPAIRRLVTFDATAELNEMSMTPLRIASTPDAPYAHLFAQEMLDANLDHEMQAQLSDGSWELGWDWSALDAEAWAAAEREWKGHVIVQKLTMLRAYGRI